MHPLGLQFSAESAELPHPPTPSSSPCPTVLPATELLRQTEFFTHLIVSQRSPSLNSRIEIESLSFQCQFNVKVQLALVLVQQDHFI